MQYLQNESLILRKPEPEDLNFLYSIENNTKFWHLSETKAPFTKWHIRQHIESSNYDIYTNKELRLIIENKKKHVQLGVIDLFDLDPHNLRAGIGIIITEEYQNQGIASKSLGLVINYAFNFLMLNQLFCHIDLNNKKSIKLFEKNKFTKTGILKEWKRMEVSFTDVAIYQLLKKL